MTNSYEIIRISLISYPNQIIKNFNMFIFFGYTVITPHETVFSCNAFATFQENPSFVVLG